MISYNIISRIVNTLKCSVNFTIIFTLLTLFNALSILNYFIAFINLA